MLADKRQKHFVRNARFIGKLIPVSLVTNAVPAKRFGSFVIVNILAQVKREALKRPVLLFPI